MKNRVIHVFGYLVSLVAFCFCVFSLFISTAPKIQGQAIYWFYTGLLSASLPYLASVVLPKMRSFKFKDVEIDLEAKLDHLARSTEEQSLKMISYSITELSGSDYISQLARIIEKERRIQSGVCIVYADIDGLRSHLADKENARLLRVKALEFLNTVLEAGALKFEKSYDIFALTVREPDSILIVRQISLACAVELAEYVRSQFMTVSKGDDELELGEARFLTVSLSVVSSDYLEGAITTETVRNLHSHGLDLLDDAKNQGKNIVKY